MRRKRKSVMVAFRRGGYGRGKLYAEPTQLEMSC